MFIFRQTRSNRSVWQCGRARVSVAMLKRTFRAIQRFCNHANSIEDRRPGVCRPRDIICKKNSLVVFAIGIFLIPNGRVLQTWFGRPENENDPIRDENGARARSLKIKKKHLVFCIPDGRKVRTLDVRFHSIAYWSTSSVFFFFSV